MVLMSAGRAARHQSSLSNQTTHFGIMGGLVSTTNAQSSIIRARQIGARSNLAGMPTKPIPGKAYLIKHDILSRNPQASGGVGKRVLLYTTGQQQPS